MSRMRNVALAMISVGFGSRLLPGFFRDLTIPAAGMLSTTFLQRRYKFVLEVFLVW